VNGNKQGEVSERTRKGSKKSGDTHGNLETEATMLSKSKSRQIARKQCVLGE